MFTIYERDDDYPGASNAVYRVGSMVLGDLVADSKARRKHFTDAELAAEYWCEEAEALFWAPERGRIHSDQSTLHKGATERVAILERFATHRHALEDS